jgi:hypothetical protein
MGLHFEAGAGFHLAIPCFQDESPREYRGTRFGGQAKFGAFRESNLGGGVRSVDGTSFKQCRSAEDDRVVDTNASVGSYSADTRSGGAESCRRSENYYYDDRDFNWRERRKWVE